tara:strand:- start:1261 stop:1716 length:456 start_codon:yes stop_codon:yes gene_type:complete
MVSAESINQVWDILNTVPDPEIPAISIVDLGIVRDVKFENNNFEILITPTYSGCPAMTFIEQEIISHLQSNKIQNFELKKVLSPPWTTDWMSDTVKDKLKKAGISPPSNNIICPQCDSLDVEVISTFGSTACKSFYKCQSCLEPFHHFKKF